MPSPRIRIGDDYYLLAAALPSRGRQLVLNHGNSFVIVNEAGDCPLSGNEPFGFCHMGTRFLDRYELRLNGAFPLLLDAAVTDDGSEQVTYLTNADERRGDELLVQRDSVAVERRKVLHDGVLYETLLLHNYGASVFALEMTLLFTSDFADIFELRGMQRASRGTVERARIEGTRVTLGYRGLDDVERALELDFAPDAWRVEAESATVALRLAPGENAQASVRIRCIVDAEAGHAVAVPTLDAAAAHHALRDERERTLTLFPSLDTNDGDFDAWVSCSQRDLALLRASSPDGDYVYAGIPWFATIFGRDGLLTALETLAFAPEFAAGTLRRLAALQGRTDSAERDEAPGKILHEQRYGEMAATGEVPFGRYYGSVDATPLFVAVLAAYADRTADLELVRELWPAATAAMTWIRNSLDERGFLTYCRRTPTGLSNQGWKDSHDAISHADGALATAPIALCEVQGYVYAALVGMSQLAPRVGDDVAGARYADEARALRQRFDRAFWLDDEGTYALALDRDGRPCRVVASNAGHCLLSGIALPERVGSVVMRLMSDDCFCGWGIRTLSAQARRFNPMSYHNGSVWPHDNALIAAGFARCGFGSKALAVLSAMFDVSRALEDRRLPELFCGFARSQRSAPVAYPVACRPQAWAAGSAMLLIQAILGLTVDGWRRRVLLTQATLPPWLNVLELRGLRVRDAELDLRVVRGRRSAALEVMEKRGDVDVVVRK